MRTPRRRPSIGICLLLVISLAACLPSQEQVTLPGDPLAAIAEMSVSAAVAKGTEVRVVDPKGKAISGALVVSIPRMDRAMSAKLRPLQEQIENKYGRDPERGRQVLFLLLGTCYRTDENGVTRVATMDRSGAVLVVRGKDTALVPARKIEDGHLQVVVRRDLPIHVLVVDPKGRPVKGVPVALMTSADFPNWEPSRKTDANGRVAMSLGAFRSYPRDKLYVRAQIVSRKPAWFEFDPKTFTNDAEHPAKITLPAYGQVRVYVLDKDQKPLMGIEGASLTIVPEQASGHGSERRFFASRGMTFQADEVHEDSATFSFVEVGTKLSVGCTYRGSARPERVSSDGPRHHMDMRVVMIAGVGEPTRVTMRLLGLDGKPVINERVGVIFMRKRTFDGRTFSTDAEGRLNILVPERFAQLDDGRLCIVRRYGPERKTRYLGSKEFSFQQVRGKQRTLGDVKLVEEALLARGRVVDSHGKPLAEVSIKVDDVHGEFSSRSRSGDSAFYRCEAVTGVDGRFELRAANREFGVVKLQLHAAKYTVKSGEECDAGTEDLEVVMARTSSVDGSILGCKGARFRGELRLRRKDGTGDTTRASLNGDGGFAFGNCLPGEHIFELLGRRPKKVLITIDGIKVVEGEDCEDPRLAKIDITKFFRVVKVTVSGPGGKPLPRVTVWHYSADGLSGSGAGVDATGVTRMVLPKAGGNVKVDSEGYIPQQFPMLKNDVVVKMKRARLVRVEIVGIPRLPEGLGFDYRLRLAMRAPARPAKRLWGNAAGFRNSRGRLPANGRIEIYSLYDGEHTLLLSPTRSGPLRSIRALSNLQLRLEIPVTVKAAKAGEAPSVKVTLDEDQVESIKDLIEMVEEVVKQDKDG